MFEAQAVNQWYIIGQSLKQLSGFDFEDLICKVFIKSSALFLVHSL